MPPLIRYILVVIAGLLVGSLANMALITLGPLVIPNPEGVDVSDAESIAKHIHLYKPIHFLFPFLAHALGTLIGAWLATFLAKGGKLIPALVIGLFFLAGGTMMATMIPAPMWFIMLDLGLAYIPMALLGWWLAKTK